MKQEQKEIVLSKLKNYFKIYNKTIVAIDSTNNNLLVKILNIETGEIIEKYLDLNNEEDIKLLNNSIEKTKVFSYGLKILANTDNSQNINSIALDIKQEVIKTRCRQNSNKIKIIHDLSENNLLLEPKNIYDTDVFKETKFKVLFMDYKKEIHGTKYELDVLYLFSNNNNNLDIKNLLYVTDLEEYNSDIVEYVLDQFMSVDVLTYSDMYEKLENEYAIVFNDFKYLKIKAKSKEHVLNFLKQNNLSYPVLDITYHSEENEKLLENKFGINMFSTSTFCLEDFFKNSINLNK